MLLWEKEIKTNFRLVLRDYAVILKLVLIERESDEITSNFYFECA